jgi:hypothetical protein
VKLLEFKIVACPFAYSDLTSEYTEYGKNEDDALQQFRLKYPLFRVVRVEAL